MLEHEQPAPGHRSQIAVYFADTRVNLYQIRQWYAPLAELAKTAPGRRSSPAAPARASRCSRNRRCRSIYKRRVTDLEQFVDEQDLRIVFYVNQNPKNFQMFRYGRMWHVFINHGESDKMYMTTNQFKAYDYALVAGQAALDRLSRKLWDFDLAHARRSRSGARRPTTSPASCRTRPTTARSCSTRRPGRVTGPPPPTARSPRTASRSPTAVLARRATG